jgi:putative endonuclease
MERWLEWPVPQKSGGMTEWLKVPLSPARLRERVRALRSSGDVAEKAIMYYVYILKSLKAGKLYIGSSEDLKNRLAKHNAGHVRSTKAYLPWQVVYYEAHLNKTLARQAEIFYKTGQGRRQVYKKLGIT